MNSKSKVINLSILHLCIVVVFVIRQPIKDVDQSIGEHIPWIRIHIPPEVVSLAVVAIFDTIADIHNVRKIIGIHDSKFAVTFLGTFGHLANQLLLCLGQEVIGELVSLLLKSDECGLFHNNTRLEFRNGFVNRNIFVLKLFNELDKVLIGDAQVFFYPIIPIGIEVTERIVNDSVECAILLHIVQFDVRHGRSFDDESDPIHKLDKALHCFHHSLQ